MVIQKQFKNGVLVLKLEGHFQAYGDMPNHRHVMTRREPTKSAVIGIIMQACGWDFADDEKVALLAALEMIVRCDIEGSLMKDFQVVREAVSADGSVKSLPTTRYYLANASFTVALSGDPELLRQIQHGLQFPRRGVVWLGRKNCVPTQYIWNNNGLVTTGETGRQVLERWPWNPSAFGSRRRPRALRLVLDHGVGSNDLDLDTEIRHDHPLSLAPHNRRYTIRRISTDWVQTAGLPIEDDSDV